MRVSRRQTRAIIAERDGWTCCYCSAPLTPDGQGERAPTIEHRLPRSRGGTNGLENLALACWKCNNDRGDGTTARRRRPREAPRPAPRLLTPQRRKAPPGARNPILDACIVCGAPSPDNLYCGRHRED